MASVLGKRSRRALDVEDVAAPSPSWKRRTRHATLKIHDDEANTTISNEFQDASHLVEVDSPQTTPTRTISSKCIVQNKTVQLSTINEEAQDENIPPFQFRTPSTTRFKDALTHQGSVTPRHRIRLGGGKPLTPRTPRTIATLQSRSQSVYSEARQLFTQSSSPKKLVGRDAERQQLREFISNAIATKSGGCTYISGPPGTGKSALTQEIFDEFRGDGRVKIAVVNCVSLRSSKEVHNTLVQEFGRSANTAQSDKNILSDLFAPKKRNGGYSYLVMLDEMDSLLDEDCEVLYSLFEWALHRQSRLILIGIANALDLTDRFLPRLKARNIKPELLPFLPYTATQIAAIVSGRLRSILPADTSVTKDFVPFVHPMAIQLCSKKVASQTGDLRKAFSLIGRAIDQIERETAEKDKSSITNTPTKQPLAEISNEKLPISPPKSSPLKPESVGSIFSPQRPAMTAETAPRATIVHVARIASNIFNKGTTSRLAGLNLQQKAVLCSLVANEQKRAKRDPFVTPSKSINSVPTIKDLFLKYATLCKREDGMLQPLKNTEFRDVVASLETLGLVHEWSGRSSSILTPSRTPSRSGKSADDKQVASVVSEKEMKENLKGPGSEILLRLFEE